MGKVLSFSSGTDDISLLMHLLPSVSKADEGVAQPSTPQPACLTPKGSQPAHVGEALIGFVAIPVLAWGRDQRGKLLSERADPA